MEKRFEAKCKSSEFLTYAVYDNELKKFVPDTEDTDLSIVEEWATDEETEVIQRLEFWKEERK